MEKADRKRTDSLVLYQLTFLFTLSSLAFTILKKTWRSFDAKIIYNGFNLLWGDNLTRSMGTGFDSWLVLYSYILLIVLLAEIIVYFILFWKKSEKLVHAERISVIVNVLLTLVYMINGICAWNVWAGESVEVHASTAAYIPFIIVSVLAAAYFLLPRFIKDEKKE